MGKIIDITDKLQFDENPHLKVKDVEVEVNADAETMLKIMGEFKNKSEVEASLNSFELLFSDADREKILALKMPAKSLMIMIESAMSLVMGKEEKEQ